jgi:hypothetical protein
MVNKKFKTNIVPTDLSIQGEDGGGIHFNKQGKFIFGAKQKNVLDGLNEENYEGTVNVSPNNQSYFAITNEDSNAIDVDIANKNNYSLFEPSEDNILTTDSDKNKCGGDNISSTEFISSSIEYSNHENKNTVLGWSSYGSGQSTLGANMKFMFNDYWITNSQNDLKNIDKTYTRSFTNTITGTKEERNIFDIQTLPSGLRSMLLRVNYNSGLAWLSRLLVAVNSLDKNLGINVDQSSVGTTDPCDSKKVLPSLPIEEKKVKFRDQYSDILSLYQDRKEQFLQALKKELDRYYSKLVDQRVCSQSKTFNELKKKYPKANYSKVGDLGLNDYNYNDYRFAKDTNAFKTFYSDYNKLAYDIGSQFIDCPDEYTVSISLPKLTPLVSVPIPLVSVPIPSPSLTPAKTSEDPDRQKKINIAYCSLQNNIITEGDNKETSWDNYKQANNITDDEIETANIYCKNQEDTYDALFLPSSEDLPIVIEVNDGVEEGGGINDEESTVILSTATSEGSANIGGGSGGEGNNDAGYKPSITDNITDNENKALLSCKTGATNVFEVSIRMNPSNHLSIPNASLPKWKYNAQTNLILSAIGNKFKYAEKVIQYHCAAGILISAYVFHNSDLTNKTLVSGGFPPSLSSYIVPSYKMSNKVKFEKNVDFGDGNYLTDSGVNKFKQAQSFKGGIFTVGTIGSGHIGMIYYLELKSFNTKSGVKYKGYYHTLEFNTGVKNISTGGQLAFCKRTIGGSWGKRCGYNNNPVWFGDTSGWGGGTWSANGLGNDNNFSFGSSKSWSKNF